MRREEVAERAGISLAWYTWLEQARTVSVSHAALERLADALQLTAAERGYLHELARPEVRDGADATQALPALQPVVDAFAGPAYVLDRTWHVRAANRAALRLFSDWSEAVSPVNLLAYVFLNPEARTLIADWDERATRILAEFRSDSSRFVDDPEIQALIEDLSLQSERFSAAWNHQAVLRREGGIRAFHHAEDGDLTFEQTTFLLATSKEMKLVVLVEMPAK